MNYFNMINGLNIEQSIELNKLVKQEAINLKKYATKEEIARLNFKDFQYQNAYGCIYGLMTGTCLSDRANDLIIKCCKKVYAPTQNCQSMFRYDELIKPHKVHWGRTLRFASPIEKWLFLVEGDLHKRLIQFIKGEIEELKLD